MTPKKPGGVAAAAGAARTRRAARAARSAREALIIGAGGSHTLGRPCPGASRSSTTSCSTSAAPSASSRRCAISSRGGPVHGGLRRAGDGGLVRASHVNTSFLQRLRPTARTFRPLLPLYPYAMEALDLSGYDLVVSSSSAWAHGVLVDPEAVHVSYCHNPFRYAWNARETRRWPAATPLRARPCGSILKRWRMWDFIAAQRVDRYVANSDTTRRRISRYFDREATVLHPPVRDVALHAVGPRRRAVRRPVGAHAAQAHRPRRRGVQPPRPPADRDRQRARLPPAAAPGRADDPVHRAAARRGGRRPAGHRPGRSWSRRRRSSASPRSRRRPPAGRSSRCARAARARPSSTA